MPSARPYRFSIKRRWARFCALILRTVEDACPYNFLYPCVAHCTSSLLLLTYYLKKTASAVFFTLRSVVDNFVIVFINQITYKHKLKSCGCKPPLCKGRCHFLKMTEGLLYAQINMLTNTPKILFDFIIWYSNYIKPILLKKFCAFGIF